jgi:hypothetical protein
MFNRFTIEKRLVIIAASAVGAVIVCVVLLDALLERPKAPMDASEVQRAVQRFCADHCPHPETVTFSQLIAQGYLGSNALEKFGASEVTVCLNADDASPQTFLMDALMPDSSHVALLSDGSVQQFSRGRFQQAAPRNGGGGVSSGNSGVPAAGRRQ